MQTSTNIKKSKIIAIVSLMINPIVAFLGWIPILDNFLRIAAWVLMIFAVLNLSKVCKSPTLFKSYIFMCLCAILGVFVNNFFVMLVPSVVVAWIILIFTIGCHFYFGYKYYKEMRTISGIALFFYAFICVMMSFVLLLLKLFTIGSIFALTGVILELVAWITLKEVKIFGADFTQAEAAIANDSPTKTE